MKKTILFDLDGTLIDSSEGIIKSVIHALKHFGIEESNTEKLKRFIGPPLGDSFMRYYGFSKEDASRAVNVFRERYNVLGYLECMLYPGVEECLTRLSDAGFDLAIATSKPEPTARKILENLGVFHFFTEIAGATLDNRIEKKKDVLAELFRRQQDFKIPELYMVGDTEFDIEGANEYGMDSIGVSFGFGDAEEMLRRGAKTIRGTMEAVADYILEENEK